MLVKSVLISYPGTAEEKVAGYCKLPLPSGREWGKMLVLTRKCGESIRIGDDIEIIVTAIETNKVKIGIRSPRHVPVHRQELYLKIQEENKQAAMMKAGDLDELLRVLSSSDKKPAAEEHMTNES